MYQCIAQGVCFASRQPEGSFPANWTSDHWVKDSTQGTWTSDHSAKDSTQGSKDRQHGNEVLACSATPEMLKADLDSQTSIRHRNRHVHPAIDMHTSYACILT